MGGKKEPVALSLLSVHCSYFTAHNSLFTTHSSQFSVHSSQFTVHRSPFTARNIMNTELFFRNIPPTPFRKGSRAGAVVFQFTFSPFALHSSHFTIHSSQFTVHSSPPANIMNKELFFQNIPPTPFRKGSRAGAVVFQFTFSPFTLHNSLFTLHTSPFTAHSSQFTVHRPQTS